MRFAIASPRPRDASPLPVRQIARACNIILRIMACALAYHIPIWPTGSAPRSTEACLGGNMTVTSEPVAPPIVEGNYFRWLQLVMGIVCMAMIANLQYGWTLFVDPIDAKNHWGRASIQLAFTIFVVTETWLVPVEAWFVDKYGPSIVVMFGGVMIAMAWVVNSYAESLTMLYTAAVIAGIGAGAVYGTCVGNALKWFPDRRGLAA